METRHALVTAELRGAAPAVRCRFAAADLHAERFRIIHEALSGVMQHCRIAFIPTTGRSNAVSIPLMRRSEMTSERLSVSDSSTWPAAVQAPA